MARKGGTAVMVGVVPFGASVELPGADIVLREKTILGCMMGVEPLPHRHAALRRALPRAAGSSSTR